MTRCLSPFRIVWFLVTTACHPPPANAALHEGKYQLAPKEQGLEKSSGARPGKLAAEFASGELRVAKLGDSAPEKPLQLPLEHTDVSIRVSGFVARARVTQRYANPFEKPIEAIYTFPLPQDAAVDGMTMKIGQRTIRGEIKKRAEARKIYEAAKAAGQRASLLEQERPNIFTQAVANIMPGDAIEILIEYVDILAYSDGAYELVFPLVVGPRYIPGKPQGKTGEGFAPDTDRVPDGSRITPPVLKPGQRSGHDISLAVEIDAGVVVQGLYSTSHALDVWDASPTQRRVKLSPADIIPNKDFVLRYQTAGRAPQIAVLPYHDERGGFFTLIVQPQREVKDDQVVPRELIFIVDTSGSMRGFPMEKSKEAMRRLIRHMRPSDRFNIVRFAGGTGTLFESPQPHSAERVQEALRFVDGFTGSGGTEMAKGISQALQQPAAAGYLRIAFLLSDGFVSEAEVFGAINEERRGARVFTLGIGSSPNRYLMDRAAILGRGEAFYIRQDEGSEEVIARFFQRVDKPALANIEIDWAGLDVRDIYPQRIPDLFAGQPLRIHGRYERGGAATITVRGQLGTNSYRQRVKVKLPMAETEHEAIASVWARQKIKDLMLRMVRERDKQKELEEEVTTTGLRFRLMSKYTSFVAVEEKVVNVDGKTETVVQPVELPDGVDYEGVFGAPMTQARASVRKSKMGFTAFEGGSSGFGMSRGIAGIGSSARKAPRPRPPQKEAQSAPRARRSKADILRVFARHKEKIRACLDQAKKSNPDLKGKIVVTVVIDKVGKVKIAKIKSSTVKNKALESCLIARIRLLRFVSDPGGSDLEVDLPVIF